MEVIVGVVQGAARSTLTRFVVVVVRLTRLVLVHFAVIVGLIRVVLVHVVVIIVPARFIVVTLLLLLLLFAQAFPSGSSSLRVNDS